MNIKEIRTEMKLSQQRFGDKFGIPKRTIQDWESGKHKAPDYIIDMINKIVQFEKLVPMAYVFHEYRDSWGRGSEEVFNNRLEALKCAEEEWDKLTEADKKSYIEDPCGEFAVSIMPMIWDEYEESFVTDYSEYDTIWSAI